MHKDSIQNLVSKIIAQKNMLNRTASPHNEKWHEEISNVELSPLGRNTKGIYIIKK